MYHVDSTRRIITAYDFDAGAGVVGPGRVFVSDEAEPGIPDGVTVDAEGYVWNCKWAGGRIVRYAPDGTIDRVVPLPVPRPTRCAFVGDDLETLAMTSARIGLDAAALADAPLSRSACCCSTPTPAACPPRPSRGDHQSWTVPSCKRLTGRYAAWYGYRAGLVESSSTPRPGSSPGCR